MVSRSIDQRKAISCSLIFVVFLCLVGATVYLVLRGLNPDSEIIESGQEVTSTSAEEPTLSSKLPEPVDFQTVVDEWTKTISGNVSLAIYDLNRDEMSVSYNLDENYSTASLYKLFVVYEGYRRIQSGEWQADAPAGATGYSILKCLDLAIRESYSPCADTLWAEIGHDNLDKIIAHDFGIHHSNISQLTSNASDITSMMKLFYTHEEITEHSLIEAMRDSFLNQPATTYNWRQGLPSGFSKANVYNKVGWDYNPGGYWNIYHDAAVVEFPDDRDFIVVVMTNKVPFEKIREFGSKLEEAYFHQ